MDAINILGMLLIIIGVGFLLNAMVLYMIVSVLEDLAREKSTLDAFKDKK